MSNPSHLQPLNPELSRFVRDVQWSRKVYSIFGRPIRSGDGSQTSAVTLISAAERLTTKITSPMQQSSSMKHDDIQHLVAFNDRTNYAARQYFVQQKKRTVSSDSGYTTGSSRSDKEITSRLGVRNVQLNCEEKCYRCCKCERCNFFRAEANAADPFRRDFLNSVVHFVDDPDAVAQTAGRRHFVFRRGVFFGRNFLKKQHHSNALSLSLEHSDKFIVDYTKL